MTIFVAYDGEEVVAEFGETHLPLPSVVGVVQPHDVAYIGRLCMGESFELVVVEDDRGTLFAESRPLGADLFLKQQP